jgi:hypothetical protein
MENDNNAVEQPVEKAPEVTTPEASQVNYAQEIAKLEAEKMKLAEERENYRKAALNAKKQLRNNSYGAEEEEEDEDLDARIARVVVATQQSSREAEIDRQKQALLDKALKENEELKRALTSRSGGSPASVGANLDRPEVKPNLGFSPEQESALRTRAKMLGFEPESYLRDVANNMSTARNEMSGPRN